MMIKSNMSADGHELIISIKGRFDFNSLQQFKNAYENQEDKPKKYIIDLKESGYLDSSALGMLLALRVHAGGDRASVKIKNCNPDIKKILMRTRLNELFTVE